MSEQDPESDIYLHGTGKIRVRLARPGEMDGTFRHTKEDWERWERKVREEEIARARANGIKPLEQSEEPDPKDSEEKA